MKAPENNKFVQPGALIFESLGNLSSSAAEMEARELSAALHYHGHRYYVLDDPQISDGTYDAMFQRLLDLEEAFPQIKTADSPTQRVGAPPKDSLPTVDHLSPMLSLDSSHEEKKVRDFDDRLKRALAMDLIDYVMELKFDGLSIEAVYRDGLFERGSTRGDGHRGEEISENLRTIPSLPLRLVGSPPPLLAVRGEVYMPLDGFHGLNRNRLERGEEPFANPRNAAAGALRQLDSSITATRPLDVFFYDPLAVEWGPAAHPEAPASHWQELDLLRQWGFKVNDRSRFCRGIDQVIELHHELEQERDELPYEIDGIVIKVDGLSEQRDLGLRSRSPRWAFAYKFAPRLEVTTVEDIILQVGRTGILTPVALLAPVEVGGVTISRASLHNYDQVREKDIRPGDQVRVARAGDVIPYVVERVDTRPESERSEPFEMPDLCPVSGSEVVRDGAYFVCTGGLSCSAQLLGSVQHYASRGALDIEGLGEKTVRQLIAVGLIRSSLADLYQLTEEDLLPLDLFAETKAENLIAAIEASKGTTLSRFIYGLGIRHVGEHIADVLAQEFGSVEALMAANEEALLDVHEVGPGVARSVREFFADPANREVIRQLREAGIEPRVEERLRVFDGERFVVTGSLERWGRTDVAELLESLGARVTSSVSAQTDYLVVGGKPGSKARRAAELGVEILDEEEFVALLQGRGVKID